MKSSPSKLRFFTHSLTVVKDEPMAEQKTPYLKAILSGTIRISSSEKFSTDLNPDRAAALRYIKESAILRK